MISKILIGSGLCLFVVITTLYFLGRNGLVMDSNIKINATAEEIWQLLVDSEKIKKWNPEIISDEPLDEMGVSVGARGKIKLKEYGEVNEYISELTEVEPQKKLVLTLSGKPLGKSLMYVGYELIEKDKLTTVRFYGSWKPNEFFLKLMTPMIRIAALKNQEKAKERLKSVAEAP